MAVKKLKRRKASGPSGVTAELLQASDFAGIEQLHKLLNDAISEETLPTDWMESYLLSLFKGKGTATERERSNYRGLMLIEHPLKVLERVVEVMIRDIVDLDSMQFGFHPGRGTTDAIFILRQM